MEGWREKEDEERGKEEGGKGGKKADDGAGRGQSSRQQAAAQAHLRQTNKPDPAGSLLSTTPLTLRFHQTMAGE